MGLHKGEIPPSTLLTCMLFCCQSLQPHSCLWLPQAGLVLSASLTTWATPTTSPRLGPDRVYLCESPPSNAWRNSPCPHKSQNPHLASRTRRRLHTSTEVGGGVCVCWGGECRAVDQLISRAQSRSLLQYLQGAQKPSPPPCWKTNKHSEYFFHLTNKCPLKRLVLTP